MDTCFEQPEFEDQRYVFGGEDAGAHGWDGEGDGVEVVFDVFVPFADEMEVFFGVVCVGVLC